MGNEARYWFKGKILLPNNVKKKLAEQLDQHEIKPGISFLKDAVVETEYDSIDKCEYLIFLYVEATNMQWKTDFEEFCYNNGIPIQKWMEG